MSQEKLQYDPRTKQQIKDLLYAHLYDPVLNQYREKLRRIIQRNSTILASSHQSFSYRGHVYKVNEQEMLPRRMNTLHESLQGEMNGYLLEVQHLNECELPYVMNFINQVLNASDDLKDYLRALPDSMHAPIQNLMATCGCRNIHLSEEQVTEIQSRNEKAVNLIKQRMVLNLLM